MFTFYRESSWCKHFTLILETQTSKQKWWTIIPYCQIAIIHFRTFDNNDETDVEFLEDISNNFVWKNKNITKIYFRIWKWLIIIWKVIMFKKYKKKQWLKKNEKYRNSRKISSCYKSRIPCGIICTAAGACVSQIVWQKISLFRLVSNSIYFFPRPAATSRNESSVRFSI